MNNSSFVRGSLTKHQEGLALATHDTTGVILSTDTRVQSSCLICASNVLVKDIA